MKLNIYKSSYDDFEELNNKILEIHQKGDFVYEQTQAVNSDDDNVNLTLYLEKHSRNSPKWHREVGSLFSYDIENDNGYILNGLIVSQTDKSIYILSFGNAHHKVTSLCDIEFGLDFAERAIEPRSVEIKSVSYALSNKTKEITNFKENQTELPQANESYSNIVGKPKSENIYGKNIECGLSVKTSKNISIDRDSAGVNIFSIFNEIDNTMVLKPEASIPRFKKISQKDNFNDELYNILLNGILNDDGQFIDLSLNKIIEDGKSIYILNNNISIKSYVNNKFWESKEAIKFNKDAVLGRIQYYTDKYDLNNINCIKLKFIDESGESVTKLISEVIHCEIEHKGQTYILDNGRWHLYNNAFLELLDENLDYITSKAFIEAKYKIDYPTSDESKGEDAYIAELVDDNSNSEIDDSDKTENSNQFVKLHKKFMDIPSSVGVELADIFSQNDNELVAIKRGMNTKDITHSFNQSSLAINALNNKNEFNIQSFLEEKVEDSSIHEQILNCKNYSVLWLVKEDPKYMYDMVNDDQIDLKKIKSIFVRLAINNWYQKSTENNFNPKIYFALDSPIEG